MKHKCTRITREAPWSCTNPFGIYVRLEAFTAKSLVKCSPTDGQVKLLKPDDVSETDSFSTALILETESVLETAVDLNNFKWLSQRKNFYYILHVYYPRLWAG